MAAISLAATLGVAGWPQWWWSQGEPFTRPGTTADVLIAAQVASLLLWRWPLACFFMGEAMMLTYGLLGFPSTPADYAALVATAVGAWGAESAIERYGVLAIALGGMVGVAESRSGAPWAEIVADMMLVGFAWLAGSGVRAQQESLRSRRQLAMEAEARSSAEEKLAMAAVLHDHVGRGLVLATRRLEASQMQGGGTGALHLVGSACDLLRATLDEVSDLVNGWSRHGVAAEFPERQEPESGVLGSWWVALSALGVDVAVMAKGDLSALDEPAQTLLSAALGEAIANVARHSAGTSVEVRIQVTPRQLALYVYSAGPARDGAGAGTGLARLRDRVQARGGTLVGKAEGGGGFLVELHIPLHERDKNRDGVDQPA
jgi:signal transduction histidine kinase